MKSQVTLSLESILVEKAEHEGGLSELVSTLLYTYFQEKRNTVIPPILGQRDLTAYGMLAGQPGSVDDFIARKAEEKELDR